MAKDPPVDPRVARSRELVLGAALEELAEVGYGAFRIESVATRAGVAKTTIYRHWDGKLTLVADAFETLNEQPAPEVQDGSTHDRVRVLLHHLVDVFNDSTFSACIPALIEAAEHHPEVRRFHHRYAARRRQRLVRIIADGVEGGELPADLDPEIATLALIGPIFYARLMTGKPFERKKVDPLIETVLG